jgi:hypothetical protein
LRFVRLAQFGFRERSEMLNSHKIKNAERGRHFRIWFSASEVLG